MKIIDNFLPTKLIESVVEENQKLLSAPIWSTNLSWDPIIVKSSSAVLSRNLSDDLNQYIYKKLLLEDVLPLKKNLNITTMAYLWHPLSFIPWHCDKIYAGAATLYLNKKWDPDWGGYLLWKEKNEIRGSAPEYNRIIINPGKVAHSTTIIAKDAPLRQTIQIFWS